MLCQKCRAPLKLHSSLQNLNPASFNLLADATPIPTGPTLPSRPPYSSEHKKNYDDAVRDTKGSQAPRPSQHGSGPPSPSATRGADKGAMSFINVTDSQIVPQSVAQKAALQTPPRKKSSWSRKGSSTSNAPPSSPEAPLSQRAEASTRLFEVLSSRTDIDHPICNECTDALIVGMEKRLAAATKDRDAYLDFLKHARADMPTEEEAQERQRELEEIKKQEQDAFVELESLEAEKAAMEAELAALAAESKDLEKEEETFWHERNAVDDTIRHRQDEKASLELRYAHDERLLQDLSRVNVYNDAFNISHAGPKGVFATINGLRMGRTTDLKVDWAEINAAWGMTCLLLSTVADKLSYTFQGYRLNPLGSTSSIDELKTPTPKSSVTGSTISTGSSNSNKDKASTIQNWPLFYASDLPIDLPFMHRRFSEGMVHFLSCLQQLGRHVHKITRDWQHGSLELPCKIEGDKLQDPRGGKLYSIKLVNWNEWTRACKFVLTDLKTMLAVMVFVERRESSSKESEAKDGKKKAAG